MAYATIYEDFGTPQEKVTRKTVTLAAGKEMHEIATVAVAGERGGGQGAANDTWAECQSGPNRA